MMAEQNSAVRILENSVAGYLKMAKYQESKPDEAGCTSGFECRASTKNQVAVFWHWDNSGQTSLEQSFELRHNKVAELKTALDSIGYKTQLRTTTGKNKEPYLVIRDH